MALNFELAPPAKTVDGLLAVPIDISAIDVAFVFDGAASTAAADATITYTVGPTTGTSTIAGTSRSSSRTSRARVIVPNAGGRHA